MSDSPKSKEMYALPDKSVTADPVVAAEAWAKAFYTVKDALSRIRPVPEQLLRGTPVKDLDETLLECDSALELGED